ncbi:MAG: hypothetical protein RR137_09170 [Odoribacter sp.]
MEEYILSYKDGEITNNDLKEIINKINKREEIEQNKIKLAHFVHNRLY